MMAAIAIQKPDIFVHFERSASLDHFLHEKSHDMKTGPLDKFGYPTADSV
jgi:hypothetical protein